MTIFSFCHGQKIKSASINTQYIGNKTKKMKRTREEGDVEDTTHVEGEEQKKEENVGAIMTVTAVKQTNGEEASNDNSRKPITQDGDMPQKKFYRSRAHCNPLSHNDAFEYPANPRDLDWTKEHYPGHPLIGKNDTNTRIVPTVLDIGCGFGGLTVALSKLLPEETILALEIRSKVCEYVRLKIMALRKEFPAEAGGSYENCSVMRSNTMKFMPNLFERHSLQKLFFCFPDPHFKRKNHPRRIISDRLLTEYAYFLKPTEGKLYCITDVEDLHEWHMAKCRAHPLFRELAQEELSLDPSVEAMRMETEEGKKVERSGANKYYAVFQRVSLKEEAKAMASASLFASDTTTASE
jgi:tRNA (guanine-N7-)-methyltransferase